MNQTFVGRVAWLVPSILLLAGFGRLLTQPSGILVDAARPTVDRARVVAAAPGNDLTRQFWPLQRYVARSIARTGHLPGWDDRGFGGRPLVGNPQAGLFYPPTWVAWVIPAPATLGWITVGHLLGAIGGMRRLARTLGIGECGAAVAAGCFALSPYVLAQTFEGHYPHVWAACWYPLAFDALIRSGRGCRRAALTLAGCLAAVVLVGHPQEGYYLAVALGVWAGAILFRRASRAATRRMVPGLVAVWCGVALLAAGLAAVELIPAARAQAWGLQSARLPLRLASRYHPLAINAVQALNPFALGGPSEYFGPENYWETVLSVGLVPLFLAGVGATWTADRGRVRPWVWLATLAVVFAAGRRLGLFALCYDWVPGMDRFRVPARSLFLASLAMAVLAGLGVEALRAGDAPRPGPDRWFRLARSWLMAVLIVGGAIGWGWRHAARAQLDPGALGAMGGVEETRSRSRSTSDRDRLALALSRLAVQPVFGMAITGVTLGLVCGVCRPRNRREIALGLGLLGLVELAGSGWQLLAVSPPAAFLELDAIGKTIATAAAPGRKVGPPLRVRADEVLVTDLRAVELGLTKTDINDSFQIQHAADLYQHLYDLSRPRPVEIRRPMDGPVAERIERLQRAILDRMAVELAVADAESPRLLKLIEAAGWPVVARQPTDGRHSSPVVLARNPSALPRAYMVPRAAIVAVDDARVVDGFATADPRRAVLMTTDPLAEVGERTPRQEFRPAEWVDAQADRLVLDVTTEGPGLLVVADTWMPGWTARVDGRVAPILRGNHAQRVITLKEPGRHRIILEYHAPGLVLGAALSAGALIIWSSLRWATRAQPRSLPDRPVI